MTLDCAGLGIPSRYEGAEFKLGFIGSVNCPLNCKLTTAETIPADEFHTPSGNKRPAEGPKGCYLPGAVRNALSAATRRQTVI